MIYSLSIGVMLATSSVCLLYETVDRLNGDFKISILISSSAFLFMLIVENFYTVFNNSIAYNQVGFDSEINKTGNDEDIIDMQNLEKIINDPITEHSELDLNNINPITNLEENKKLPPSILLIVSSIHDTLVSILISSKQHTDLSELVNLITHKLLNSIAIGAILEELKAPQSVSLIFLMVFSLSSPIGIIIGGFIIPTAGSILLVIKQITCVFSAISSGVTLYVSIINMIPAQNEHLISYCSNNNVDMNKMKKNLLIQSSFLLFGYILSILQCFLFKLY